MAQAFFEQVPKLARQQDLLSDEHFTVDGTLIEAWAGQKSFQKKDTSSGRPPDDPGNPTVDFHGEKRSNQTHQSTTDPDARLYREGSRQGSQAELSGTRVDGEPQRAGHRNPVHAANVTADSGSGRGLRPRRVPGGSRTRDTSQSFQVATRFRSKIHPYKATQTATCG